MSAGLYLRRAAKIRALRLTRNTRPDEIADFVSSAKGDWDVRIKPSSVVMTNRKAGFQLDARPGDDHLVRSEKNELQVYGNDEFESIHEYLGEIRQ